MYSLLPSLLFCLLTVLWAGCDGEVGPTDDVHQSDAHDAVPDVLEVQGSLLLKMPHVAGPGACVPLRIYLFDEDGKARSLDDDRLLNISFDDGVVTDAEDCSSDGSPFMFPANAEMHQVAVRVGQGTETRVHVSLEGFLPATEVIPVSEDGYVRDERPEKTLVIYNEHASGAQAIAEYYVQERGIEATHLCPVRLPQGLYATPNELLGARRTIVEQCICPLVAPSLAPTPCSVAQLDAISEQSPITHITVVRGVPARLTGTIWPTDSWDPSFDFYLSVLLARDLPIFEESNGALQNPTYPIQESVKGTLGAISPDSHGFLAIGRIEGLTVDRTLALIDRTLLAERTGFQGNILTERSLDSDRPFETPGRYFTSSFRPECINYLSHEPFVFEAEESTWNPSICRWGSTGSSVMGAHAGMMPGSVNTTVPYAYNVSLFLGSEPRPAQQPTNGQVGFNNHATMLKWRRNSEPCVPLCQELGTDSEVSECISNSEDYFKQINSQCAGVSPGFLGQQVRSYPVQYFGFYPPGWSAQGGGGDDKTPPMHMSEGGTDGGAYVHFGGSDHQSVNADVCSGPDLESLDCREHLAVNLRKVQVLTDTLSVDEPRPFLIRFSYRNQGAEDAFLDLRLCLNDCKNDGVVDLRDENGLLPALDMQEDHLAWTEAEFRVFATSEQAEQIEKITLWFDGRLHKLIRGFVDLDDVSVVHESTGLVFTTSNDWGFERLDRTTNVAGGFASDAIERMGGIAVWGSSSHHLTGGWAWQEVWQVAGALFQGRSLGESLVMSSAKSGIVYGDPLYRPFAVHISNSRDEHMVSPFSKLVLDPDEAEATDLFLSVLHGTAYMDTLRWSLDRCAYEDPAHCNDGDWAEVYTGVGAVRKHRIPIADIQPIEANSGWTLRLRAWQPEDESNHISAYGRYEIMNPR